MVKGENQRETEGADGDRAGSRRVLLTGGAGFVGSHTCVALIEAGYEPVIVDTFTTSHPTTLDRLRRLTGSPIECHRVDVRDVDALRQVLVEGEIGAVVHFAALKAVGESVSRPLDYYDLNVGGTISVVKAMMESGVRRLVFSGSCSVFGDGDRGPLSEDSTVAPTNPYARTKAMCEQLLIDTCAATSDLSCTSLRYFNPIGAHPSGQLGEDPRGTPNNVLPLIMEVATDRRPALAVFGDDYPTPDGTCIRDYLHVCDIARAHVQALDQMGDDRGFRAFNLGTGVGRSVLELVAQARDVTGHPIPVVMSPRRPGDVPVLVADPTLARRELGWTCEYDLTAMVTHAWRFHQLSLVS